jgi:hypothetical protein
MRITGILSEVSAEPDTRNCKTSSPTIYTTNPCPQMLGPPATNVDIMLLRHAMDVDAEDPSVTVLVQLAAHAC